MLKNNQMQW